MKVRDINNFFGDMDLYLIDAILKGLIPESGSVLDLGCGAGRNAVHFLNQGYEYVGVDSDESQILLCQFMSKNFEDAAPRFYTSRLQELDLGKKFDLIICSQVLHFANDEDDFFEMWACIERHVSQNGVVYIAMDSVVNTTLGKKLYNGLVEFPDGKMRFALTENLFTKIKKGFEEIEPLRIFISHNKRAQSVLFFKKIKN